MVSMKIDKGLLELTIFYTTFADDEKDLVWQFETVPCELLSRC